MRGDHPAVACPRWTWVRSRRWPTPRCRARGQAGPVIPRQVPARGPTPRSRARVGFAMAGGRTPWGHAASGPGLHPSRRTANGGEGGTVLGAEGSARTGGGCAAGAQDETPLSDPPMRQRIWQPRSGNRAGDGTSDRHRPKPPTAPPPCSRHPRARRHRNGRVKKRTKTPSRARHHLSLHRRPWKLTRRPSPQQRPTRPPNPTRDAARGTHPTRLSTGRQRTSLSATTQVDRIVIHLRRTRSPRSRRRRATATPPQNRRVAG